MLNYTNFILSLLLRKIIIPSDFQSQVMLGKEMIKSDTSGLVDSLSQFMVDSASVELRVDTENENFNGILEEWLDNINNEWRGKGVEVGIRGLLREYLNEIWKGAGFPVLKISKWEKIDGYNFPTSMFFVDGGSIYAKDKEDTEKVDLFGYNYFLGKDMEEEIEGEAFFMYKPFFRWFEKYPTPFFIRRGIFKNWKLIELIKDKQIEMVDRIIPYMLLVLEGSEELTKQGIVPTDPQLEGIKTKIQEMIDKMNTIDLSINRGLVSPKSPIRASNFAEEIKHLIPDMRSMFDATLTSGAERNILSGFGFIDVVQAVSTSRRESVLNPVVFINQVNSGIEEFKNTVVKDLLNLIKEKNSSAIKYMNEHMIVESKPVTVFMTDNFLNLIRSLSDRGLLSNELTSELCGKTNVNYELEKRKRTRETEAGDEYIMYPKLIQNQEEKGTDIQGQPPKKLKSEKEVLPDRKKGTPEAENFNQAILDEDLQLETAELEIEEINDELVSVEGEEIRLEEAKQWKKNRTTVNYVRLGQINPNKFQKESFKTIWISKDKKIKAIIGRLIGEKTTTIQSYLFDVNEWDKDEAQKWLEINKAELVGAPYANIKDLPPAVQKRLDIEGQRKWMTIFNNAYSFYTKKFGQKKGETMAFKVAWSKTKSLEKSMLIRLKEILIKKQIKLTNKLLNKKE
jgi:cation transport regulator ChaB